MKYSRTLAAGLITLAASSLAGCLVSAPPPPPVRPMAYSYEEPVYHDGYVVHFDTSGLPYIYVGRVPRYISHDHPRYPYLMRRSPGYARNTGYGRDSGYGRNTGYGRDSGYGRNPGYDRNPGYGRRY